MFIGHFAVALGAKKMVPTINLGVLFLACQLLDLIWPCLVLLGIESVSIDHTATVVNPLNFEYYPYSHSLVMSIIYSLALGTIVAKVTKSRRGGIVTGCVVFSHWILDYITHRPDLPLTFDGLKVGLAMWNSLILTTSVELTLFATGIWLYLKSNHHPSAGKGFWALMIFLLVLYAGNIIGPKPEVNTPAAMIAGPAMALWIIVLLAFKIDRTKV